MTTSSIHAMETRLAQKREALTKSDAAINTLTDLIVAAANGEAVTESGARLSMSDAVRGADALRQVHAVITNDIETLEKQIAKARRMEEHAPFAASLQAMIANARVGVENKKPRQ